MSAYIITGPPGSGKTTLINALSSEGYLGLPEIPRKLIKEQIAEREGISPFTDLEAFFGLVFDEMYKQYLSVIDQDKTCFFDRSMPDVLGYSYKYRIPFHEKHRKIILNSKFCNTVFFCPPWKEIYVKDNERPYPYSEVKLLGKFLLIAYKNLGFKINVLPNVSVNERVIYIKDKIWKIK
ncbi:MAG: AAA family ATPase [Victivallales bacterium]|nr:AAA family ATPase [Victivallales bacterium]